MIESFFAQLNFTPMEELALVLVLASLLGIILRLLKQPLILAYLVTGLIIGFFSFFSLEDQEAIKFFSTLGVMFLLFLVGMEMDYRAIKKIGKLSLAIGLGQVIFTSIGGFLLTYFVFGFELLHAIYIAIALTFSSTVIIIKLLSDKGALNSLHGRAAVGLLLVQDLIVVLILISLTALGERGGDFNPASVIFTILGGLFLFLAMVLLGRFVFPYLFRKIARSQELLFLTSLAWLLLFSSLVKQAGFSIEIAGFLAGVALANSSEKYHIASKITPLRDFFILIFFALLGSLMAVSDFSGIGVPVIFLSLFVLIGNPIIVMTIMGIMRYKKRTGFLTGVTVAQISEFSLIFATLGLTLGHITDQIFALIAMVGVITITLSTYLILYAEKIFDRFFHFFSIFERDRVKEEDGMDKMVSKPIILIGAHRTGRGVMEYLNKEDILVIDFDPVITDSLKKEEFAYLFSDISDPHIFDNIDLSQARLIISTSPHLKDNLTLLKKVKEIKEELKVILRAEDYRDALSLYKEGADYVLLPHFSSGQYLGKIIDPELNLDHLKDLKEEDIRMLKKEDDE